MSDYTTYTNTLTIGAICAMFAAAMSIIGILVLMNKIERLETQFHQVQATLMTMAQREYQRDRCLELMMAEIRKPQ